MALVDTKPYCSKCATFVEFDSFKRQKGIWPEAFSPTPYWVSCFYGYWGRSSSRLPAAMLYTLPMCCSRAVHWSVLLSMTETKTPLGPVAQVAFVIVLIYNLLKSWWSPIGRDTGVEGTHCCLAWQFNVSLKPSCPNPIQHLPFSNYTEDDSSGKMEHTCLPMSPEPTKCLWLLYIDRHRLL